MAYNSNHTYGTERAMYRYNIGHDEKNNGYRVVVNYLPGHDECWETFRHFALFADKRDAEALRLKMHAKYGQFNFRKYWHWGEPNRCSPLSLCHEVPSVVMETTPRPSSFVSF